MPRVSVIIPSYNHEKFVAEAIESVLKQTYQDFEIVITDDGSKDETVRIIKSFTDPRIKLFCFNQNQGACVAANKCISEAKGELISMLSSDDVFAHDKLEKQVRFLDQNPEVGAVFSYAQIIDEDGNNFTDENHFYKHIFIQTNRTRFEWLNHFFFKGNCLCHPSALIRKQCYDEIGQYDERFAQLPDFDLWIRLCMKYEIYILPENLVNFRVHKYEANASGNKPSTKIREALELPQILKNYLRPEIYGNFIKIFPKDLNGITTIEQELADFFVAMLALQISSPIYRYFGIETLYQVFSKKDVVSKLKNQYSYELSNFIKLTGEHDTFGIVTIFQLKQKLQQAQAESHRLKLQLLEASDIPNKVTSESLGLKSIIKYPLIHPVLEKKHRPLWSVMIPTYNGTKYLEKTLRSVLEQDIRADSMQIEVIDDCSTQDDPEELVREIGKGRVSFYRQPKNVSLIANWNACIGRARGYLVHILHQDDVVKLGFYSRLQAAFEKEPTIGAAFSRYFYMDNNGREQALSPLERETPGVISNWIERIAITQRIECPSIVVKREVYEKLGGFCQEAYYAADWEMWKRISAHYPVWYEPELLASYRLHSLSETSRLFKSGRNIADTRKSIEISESYLPITMAAELSNQARENCAFKALNIARRMLSAGDIDAAIAQMREGVKSSQSLNVILSVLELVQELVRNSNQYDLLLINALDQFLAEFQSNFQELFRKQQETALKENLKLRETNLIIFPDWSQPEDLLYQDLASVITKLVNHPDKNTIALLIHSGNLSKDEANLFLSQVVLNLLLEEDLDVADGPEVSLLGQLDEIQWKILFPQIQARINLKNENQNAITAVKAENIPVYKLDELSKLTSISI